LANLPGIGLAKAKAFWTRVTNPDIRAVLPKIPAYLKLTAAIVTEAGNACHQVSEKGENFRLLFFS
jgi:hypothetical protein